MTFPATHAFTTRTTVSLTPDRLAELEKLVKRYGSKQKVWEAALDLLAEHHATSDDGSGSRKPE